MNKAAALTLSLLLGATAAWAQEEPAAAGGFTLTSPAFRDGGRLDEQQVYDSFGCSGGNVSPALAWENVPEGTKSFALMVHDPDAPTGSGWWHWTVWNIPADVRSLPAAAGNAGSGVMPKGAVQGRTDFGTTGYGGPCPPPGSEPHRYFFRLHALSVEKLDLPVDASAALVGFNVNANTIEVAELVGLYSR